MVDYFTVSTSKFKVIKLDVLEETRKAKQSDSKRDNNVPNWRKAADLIMLKLMSKCQICVKTFFRISQYIDPFRGKTGVTLYG